MVRRLAWVCGLFLALPQFAGAQLAPAPSVLLSFPGKPWGMSVDLQGYVILESEIAPSLRFRRVRAQRLDDPGFNLTAIIGETQAATDAKSCRDAAWSRLQNSPLASRYRDVRLTESGELAIVEYVIVGERGLGDMKNIHALRARDGACLDLHVSKGPYRPEHDQGLSAAVAAMQTIDIASGPAAAATVRRAYGVAPNAVLTFAVPVVWHDRLTRPKSGDQEWTVRLNPPSGHIELLASFGLPFRRGVLPPAELRRKVEATGADFVTSAVETKVEIVELKSADVQGYHFTLSRRPDVAGGSRYITYGQAVVGDATLTFTLLYDAANMPEHAVALDILRSARLTAPR